MASYGSVTAVLGGDLASRLGRKGTSSDVTLYNNKTGDAVLSFVAPSAYPEKIQPLSSALCMSDQAVLFVEGLDGFFAESVVALDAFGLRTGYVVLGDGVSANQVSDYVSGSVAESYPLIEEQVVLIREKLALLKPDAAGEAVVQVDHCFSVKGVGTVALGVVKQGTVRKHDELGAFPGEAESTVKSIQVQDTEVLEAGCGVRVGLCLKDVKPENIPRGTLLSTGAIECASELTLDAYLSKFSPRELNPGDVFMVNASLNYSPAKVREGSVPKGGSGKITLTADKKIPLFPERIILIDPSARIPRVLGHGKL